MYLKKKELIPSKHLIELSYEELINHPGKVLSEVTGRLNLDVKADLTKVQDYLATSKDFPLKKYKFSNDFLSDVNNSLGDLIVRQGYRLRKTNLDEQLQTLIF